MTRSNIRKEYDVVGAGRELIAKLSIGTFFVAGVALMVTIHKAISAMQGASKNQRSLPTKAAEYDELYMLNVNINTENSVCRIR